MWRDHWSENATELTLSLSLSGGAGVRLNLSERGRSGGLLNSGAAMAHHVYDHLPVLDGPSDLSYEDPEMPRGPPEPVPTTAHFPASDDGLLDLSYVGLDELHRGLREPVSTTVSVAVVGKSPCGASGEKRGSEDADRTAVKKQRPPPLSSQPTASVQAHATYMLPEDKGPTRDQAVGILYSWTEEDFVQLDITASSTRDDVMTILRAHENAQRVPPSQNKSVTDAAIKTVLEKTNREWALCFLLRLVVRCAVVLCALRRHILASWRRSAGPRRVYTHGLNGPE
eukprot:COSAG02_NODE_14906_length_1224_cov_1.594667_1_plen_284_part_00